MTDTEYQVWKLSGYVWELVRDWGYIPIWGRLQYAIKGYLICGRRAI